MLLSDMSKKERLDCYSHNTHDALRKAMNFDQWRRHAELNEDYFAIKKLREVLPEFTLTLAKHVVAAYQHEDFVLNQWVIDNGDEKIIITKKGNGYEINKVITTTYYCHNEGEVFKWLGSRITNGYKPPTA